MVRVAKLFGVDGGEGKLYRWGEEGELC